MSSHTTNSTHEYGGTSDVEKSMLCVQVTQVERLVQASAKKEKKHNNTLARFPRVYVHMTANGERSTIDIVVVERSKA